MHARKIFRFFALVLGLGVACAPAFAHHGTAAYDESTTITRQVVVTKFDWANPHTLILFDMKDQTSSIRHWTVETFSPGKLAHMGWKPNEIKPGDKITISFYPAKNGSSMGFLVKLTLPGGKVLVPR